jgi:hypothetical protein
MGSQTQDLGAKYLYAIVLRDGAQCAGPGEDCASDGLNGRTVYWVPHGRVAAVVSDVLETKFRPERRHLAAHHQVLKSLMDEGQAVLPVSFGVVAEDAKALRRILSLNEDAFREQIERVAGKVEMGLRVVWDVPNVFQYIVDMHPELRALRDVLPRGGRGPTQDERITLGRRFEQLLEGDRAAHTASVREVLDKICSEVKGNDPRDETEVMNLACLVGRGDQHAFEEAVLEAAKLFDDNYAFDYSGPWPPYNFVDIDLQL